MKSRFPMIMNTSTAILLSAACNGVLIVYLIWFSDQAEISNSSTASYQNNEIQTFETNYQAQFRTQELTDKFQFIESTIEKNQKFNQELKNFIIKNEIILLN